MKRLLAIAITTLGLLACTSSASAQSGAYTQNVTVQGRSGEINFFGVQLYDSSGMLRGNYSLVCNTNAINNFTCKFTLVLDSVTYYGNVTKVDTYFPVNDADSDDHGPFKYEWSAGGLTGSSAGNGHWGSGGCHTCGYAPFIEAGTTVTVN